MEKEKELQSQIKNLTSNLEDLTDAYNKLQEKLKLAVLFDALTPHAALRIDEHGVILSANPAAHKAYGKDVLDGQKWQELNQHAQNLDLKQIMQTRDLFEAEETLSGGRILSFNYHGVQEYEYIHVFGTDITEKRLAEKALEEHRAQTINQARMATLGEMAGGMAHEINTPLGVITLTVGQFLKQLEVKRLDLTSEKGIEFLTKALKNVEQAAFRISKIIQSLRKFSRSGENEPMVVADLHQIFFDVLMLMESKIKMKGIKLTYSLPEGTIQAYCAPTLLGQVIVNLLKNAYDAVQDLDEKNRWINFSLQQEQDKIHIEIVDSGPGIPLHLREHLFRPFFTTKGYDKGTGLGLSLSYGIIKRHKGTITLDEKNKNTCFIIEIPRFQGI